MHFCLLLVSVAAIGQTYVLDNTFGTGGKIVNNLTITPSKVLLIDTNYYLLAGNSLTCIDYGGQIVNGFGSGGTLTIFANLPPNENVSVTGFVYNDGFIYVYGSVSNTNNSADLLFARLSPSGVFDSSFGNSGIARINFGVHDVLSNCVFDANGELFCVGTTKNPAASSNDSKAIYFKLLNNGSVNYSFDVSGYKTIQLGAYNSGNAIVPYNGNYIVVGTTPTVNAEITGYVDLYITKINAAGIIDTSYGNNGFIRSGLAAGVGSNTISKVALSGHVLLVEHFYAFSFMNQGEYLQGYNLATNEKLYDLSQGSYCNLDLVGDKIYTTSCMPGNGGIPQYQLDNVFNLKRMNIDGSLDSTFHIGGAYGYEFPYAVTPAGSQGASASYCFVAEDDGKFMIAGRVYEFNSNKFGMIRIEQGSLDTQTPNKLVKDLVVYPNPFDKELYLSFGAKISDIKVYDLLGRHIESPTFYAGHNGIYNIDLSQITQSGTYLLEVSDDSGTTTKKIVKR